MNLRDLAALSGLLCARPDNIFSVSFAFLHPVLGYGALDFFKLTFESSSYFLFAAVENAASFKDVNAKILDSSF